MFSSSIDLPGSIVSHAPSILIKIITSIWAYYVALVLQSFRDCKIFVTFNGVRNTFNCSKVLDCCENNAIYNMAKECQDTPFHLDSLIVALCTGALSQILLLMYFLYVYKRHKSESLFIGKKCSDQIQNFQNHKKATTHGSVVVEQITNIDPQNDWDIGLQGSTTLKAIYPVQTSKKYRVTHSAASTVISISFMTVLCVFLILSSLLSGPNEICTDRNLVRLYIVTFWGFSILGFITYIPVNCVILYKGNRNIKLGFILALISMINCLITIGLTTWQSVELYELSESNAKLSTFIKCSKCLGIV